MVLNWLSPVWGHHDGYGNSAEQIVRALEKRGHTVGILHQQHLRFRGPCDRAWIAAHPEQKTSCAVYFTLPTTWMASHAYNVGFSMYESSQLPPDWKPWLDTVQEIWVPSTYCAAVFRRYSTRPIHVIPLGINPQLFPVRRVPRRGRMRLLHMWAEHSLFRKGADLAIEAFLRAFPNDRDVELVVQAAKGTPPQSDDPRIIYTQDDIPQDAMADYFSEFDALLYTSRGEGFGLLALEAASTGLPVFHSGQTGMRDYADIGVVVPARETPARVQEGTWFEIDTHVLASEILKLRDSPEAYASKALRDAKKVQRRFTWDATARKIERRLSPDPMNSVLRLLNL